MFRKSGRIRKLRKSFRLFGPAAIHRTCRLTYNESPLLFGDDSRADALLDEIMAGLTVYFDKCLGNNLLYRFERAQYVNVRKETKEEKTMSEIYGAEHLLRLFGQFDFSRARTARARRSGLIRGIASSCFLCSQLAVVYRTYQYGQRVCQPTAGPFGRIYEVRILRPR